MVNDKRKSKKVKKERALCQACGKKKVDNHNWQMSQN